MSSASAREMVDRALLAIDQSLSVRVDHLIVELSVFVLNKSILRNEAVSVFNDRLKSWDFLSVNRCNACLLFRGRCEALLLLLVLFILVLCKLIEYLVVYFDNFKTFLGLWIEMNLVIIFHRGFSLAHILLL